MATTKKTTRAKGSETSSPAKAAPKKASEKPKTTGKKPPSKKAPAAKKPAAAAKTKPAAKKTATKAKPAAKKATTTAKSPAKKVSAAKPTGKKEAKKAAPPKKSTAKASSTAASTPPAKKKPKRSKRTDTKYALHQQLVYPLQGVGQVVELQERDFKGETLLYYIIYLEVSDMTVMVPIDKADQLGIRAIVKPAESNKALKHISEDFEPVNADWKLRYQMNLDLLKSGSIMDIATVVRTLYHRSRVKELPILERKLFDNALRLMVDEISFSLDKTKDEVEQLIFARLEAD